MTTKVDMLAPDFDIDAYIRERMLNIPNPRTGRSLAQEFRREDARFIYGTRAVKQGASKHRRTRREKRG